MADSRQALSFRIFEEDRLVREVTLSQAVIKLGKVPSAHVRLDDEAVSRMHAVIEVAHGEVTLIDLGSTRGTFVNGQRIHKAVLRAGDVLGLGRTRIELGWAPPPVSVSVSPPPVPVSVSPLPAPVSVSPVPVPVSPPPVPVSVSPPPVPSLASSVASVALPTLPDAGTSRAAPAIEVAAAQGARGDEAVEADEPAEAIEIAAMLGDTVLDVRHCHDPRGGAITPVSWALIVGGLASTLIAAVLFARAVRTAADDERRLTAWTSVEHRPASAFRARRAGAAADGAALAGFALGVLGITWGAARARRERVRPHYRIGSAPGVDHAVAGAPLPAFPLVAPQGDRFVFHHAAGIEGELVTDGIARPLAALVADGRARPSDRILGAAEVAIPRGGRIRAQLGGTTFLISSVARPRRLAGPGLAAIERRTAGYLGGSLALHLGLLALVAALPPDALAATFAMPSQEDPTTHVVGVARVELPPEPERGDDGDAAGGAVGSGNATMALPDGVAGTEDPNLRRAQRPDRALAGGATSQLPHAVADARGAGILSSELLAQIDEGFGPSGGFDQRYFEGPQFGVDGTGGDGFGARRTGGLLGGCGGQPCGLFETGRYSTSSSLTDGPGPGGGFPLRRLNHVVIDPPPPSPPTITGTYDKALVRRHIRRHHAQFSYCYEKQLLADPTLAGDIVASFLISPSGAVQSASADGFHREVASCVAGVVAAIAFPAPPDGVAVRVNYPFRFHAPAR